MNASGTCLVLSADFRKECMDSSCVKGSLTTLNVPSRYHVLDFDSCLSWSCVAKTRCLFWSTCTSATRKPCWMKFWSTYNKITNYITIKLVHNKLLLCIKILMTSYMLYTVQKAVDEVNHKFNGIFAIIHLTVIARNPELIITL